MAQGESHDAMALRHLQQQDALVARQKDLIRKLEAAGESTSLAELLLMTMEETLAATRQELLRNSN